MPLVLAADEAGAGRAGDKVRELAALLYEAEDEDEETEEDRAPIDCPEAP